jgi:very-short-patch-repair endonuclease
METEDLEYFEAVIQHGCKRCESPIEKLLFRHWMEFTEFMHVGGACRLIKGRELSDWDSYPDRTPLTPLHVEQVDAFWIQPRIGKYRADFVFGRIAYVCEFEKGPDGEDDFNKPIEILKKLPLIVVECDGHDFHERTKEQAQRDKSRDREMMAMGFRVIRFTGSEIHRHPQRCAKEIDSLFESIVSPRPFSDPRK